MARMNIRIFPDGRVQGDIQGVQGKKCTNYIKIIEDLVKGQTYDSRFTKEFYEQELVQQEESVTQQESLEEDVFLKVHGDG